eukprot:jgi/Mesvir1/12312/Mv00508-RA.1
MAVDPARVVRPQPISEDLVCNICTGVLQDPVEGPCEHLACRECLDGWFQRSNDKTCPTCRRTLVPDTIKQAHRVVRNQLDALEVTCDHAARGCPAVVALGSLRNHLLSCGKAIEGCPNDGCEAIVLREDRENHLQACSHRIVPCSRCNASVKHQDREAHLRTTCPAVEVRCQHNGGCGQTVRRNAMATHIEAECSRATVTCAVPGCRRQLARGDMRAHLQDSMAEHMASLSIALQQANAKIAAQDAELAKLKASTTAHEFHCIATVRVVRNNGIRALAAANGLLLCLGSNSNNASIRVWSLKDQTCKKTLDVGTHPYIFKLHVNQDNMLCVVLNRASGGAGLLVPRDKGTSARFQPFGGDVLEPNCLAIDGTVLYAGYGSEKGMQSSVKVWDTTTEKLVGTLEVGSCGTVKELAPGNGAISALVEESHLLRCTIHVWSASNYARLAVIEAPHKYPGIAAGSGFLFCGDHHGTIMAWSAKDYSKWPVELCDHKSAISALLVHEGMLFSGSDDGKVKMWRIPTVDVV